MSAAPQHKGQIDSMSPHDRVMAAIGIMQMHVCTEETPLNPHKIWPGYFMPGQGLELALKLLIDTLEDLEMMERGLNEAPAAGAARS